MLYFTKDIKLMLVNNSLANTYVDLKTDSSTKLTNVSHNEVQTQELSVINQNSFARASELSLFASFRANQLQSFFSNNSNSISTTENLVSSQSPATSNEEDQPSQSPPATSGLSGGARQGSEPTETTQVDF